MNRLFKVKRLFLTLLLSLLVVSLIASLSQINAQSSVYPYSANINASDVWNTVGEVPLWSREQANFPFRFTFNCSQLVITGTPEETRNYSCSVYLSENASDENYELDFGMYNITTTPMVQFDRYTPYLPTNYTQFDIYYSVPGAYIRLDYDGEYVRYYTGDGTLIYEEDLGYFEAGYIYNTNDISENGGSGYFSVSLEDIPESPEPTPTPEPTATPTPSPSPTGTPEPTATPTPTTQTIDLTLVLIIIVWLAFTILSFLSKNVFFYVIAGVIGVVFGIYLLIQSFGASESWIYTVLALCMFFLGLFMPFLGLSIKNKGSKQR